MKEETMWYGGIFEDEAGIFYNIQENKIPSCLGAKLITIYQAEFTEMPEMVAEIEEVVDELKQRLKANL